MKKVIAILILILFSCYISFAQSKILQGVEIIDTNVIFNSNRVELLGIDETSSPNQLVYSFVHPRGGIQSSNGPLMTRGMEPQALRAYGSVRLKDNIDPVSNSLEWAASSKVGTNVNYYARPLSSGSDMSSNNLIASKGSINSFEHFREKNKRLKKSDPFYTIPQLEEERREKSNSFVDSYSLMEVFVGLNGKISALSSIDYKLKPEGERNKGFFGLPYKAKYNTHRKSVKNAFGNDAISYYKPLLGYPQVSDPVSGNAVIMGGVKYKKDKSKTNSHFYEFMLLTFNKHGEIVNRVKYDSEQPLKIDKVYPVYGQTLAPEVNELAPEIKEVTHCIFIAYGSGNKKTPNRNRKIRRVLVVDMRTGEIVKEDEVEMKFGRPAPIRTRRLEDNRIELTYFYPVKNKRGLGVLTISPNGIERVKEIPESDEKLASVGVFQRLSNGLTIEPVYTLDTKNEGIVTIEEFVNIKWSDGKRVGRESQGFALMKYDTEGNFIDILGIGNAINKESLKLLNEINDRMHLMTIQKGNSGLKTLKFMDANLSDFSVQRTILPEDEHLAGNSYFFDKSKNTIYFLTQKRLGKGLSVFKHKIN